MERIVLDVENSVESVRKQIKFIGCYLCMQSIQHRVSNARNNNTTITKRLIVIIVCLSARQHEYIHDVHNIKIQLRKCNMRR